MLGKRRENAVDLAMFNVDEEGEDEVDQEEGVGLVGGKR